MRIGLHTWGSEGDIRPVMSLAAALAARGHRVRFEIVGAPHPDYGELAARHGVELRAQPVPGLETPDAMDRLAGEWLAHRSPLRQAEAILSAAVDPVAGVMTETARDLCATSDLMVGHFFVHPLHTLAEKTGVPLVTLHLAHTGCPSSFIAPPGLPALGRIGNRLAWSLVRSGINRLLLARINRIRVQEGLAPITDVMSQGWTSRDLTLVAVSRVFCPQPPDWPAQQQVCGPLDAPSPGPRIACPEDIQAFLHAGEPPVYCTFGSLLPQGERHVRLVAEIWREALRLAGLRGILQLRAGAGADTGRDRRVLIVSRAPHAAVFPQCAAVVHHGGAGTVHAAVRAGVPSVVVPHVADQFFWARELTRVGAACAVVPRRRLDARRLAAALRRTLSTSSCAERARALRPLLTEENGVKRAADLIEGLVPGQAVRSGPDVRSQEVTL